MLSPDSNFIWKKKEKKLDSQLEVGQDLSCLSKSPELMWYDFVANFRVH